MTDEIKWMIGKYISKVSFRKPEAWDFQFQGGGSISAECPWRILKDGHIVVSNEDHGQQYGLTEPIDAGHSATEMLVSNRISEVKVHAGTADLIVSFDQSKQLQILPISSGYESWQVNDLNGNSIIAQGGGNIVTWKK
jgi:hypothetical protein